MKKKYHLAFLILFISAIFIFSQQATASSKNCWVAAGHYYNINPWILYSIGSVESNQNANALNVNSNNSIDIGLMQINSIWLKKLNQYHINATQLRNGCNSVFVGAWILAKSMKKYGHTWEAVGSYHSSTPKLQRHYAKKVFQRYWTLLMKNGWFDSHPHQTIPAFSLHETLPKAK